MSLFFLTVVYANGIYQTKAGDSTELPERGSTCNVSGTNSHKISTVLLVNKKCGGKPLD